MKKVSIDFDFNELDSLINGLSDALAEAQTEAYLWAGYDREKRYLMAVDSYSALIDRLDPFRQSISPHKKP